MYVNEQKPSTTVKADDFVLMHKRSCRETCSGGRYGSPAAHDDDQCFSLPVSGYNAVADQ